jgi:uncharacterized damage-inducible protein DinB
MSQPNMTSLFLDFSRTKLVEQYWPQMKKAVESLSDEQVWWRPNEASNSIGNLMLHLNGNLTQWIVASFSRAEDRRNRPAEFAAREGVPRDELIARLGATVERAGQTLARLTEAELLATYEIQGFSVSGLRAVYQVIEHFALHYGQVVYIVKQLRGEDLGYTRGLLDKSGKAVASKAKP